MTAYQEPEAELYVAWPAGIRYPDGYMSPARYVRNEQGKIRTAGNYIKVLLWPPPPEDDLQWSQWIHFEQEIFPDEIGAN